MYSLLYIDDEPGLLELGQLFLESTGEYKVTTALSGNSGLEQLARHEFDAVVSDFQMPGMDGIALLKEVRKSFGSIPFILFTGRGREEVVIEAINNGVDFYLQKGGDPKAQFAELAHKVRQAVNRRRAEIALSDSEQRLADIINFLPDATFAIDTMGVVIAWNRAMERMTGVASADILGKGDYEYAIPFYHERRPLLINLVRNDDPAIEQKYPFVKREGKKLFSEITIPHFNDGRGAALWFTASPLYNRNGDVVGAIESIREITERKRAEEALNESERRFRELADLLPQGIYEARTDGQMTYANRIALEMSGYTSEDIENGLNALDVIAPVDRPRARTIFAHMVETGSRDQGSAEYLGVRKDGSTFPVSIYSSPIYRDSRISGIRGVIIDITDQKKAEEKLVSANREYTNLLDQIQDVYYRSDTDGRLVKASRSWATLFGYNDVAECIGRNIADEFYINPSDRKRLLEEIYRNGKVTGYEVLLKKKDGTPMLVEASSHLYYDPAGKVIGIEGTFRDITDRKKAEDEIRAANEQLVASDEELRAQYDELAASEQRIRDSEERYRTVFETTGTAMLMIEDDTTISLVNAEFSRLSGYPREEIENKKKWMDFVVEEDRRRMLAQHRQRRIDPDSTLKQYEFRFVTRSEEIRNILLSIDIIPGSTKSVASLLDITERKRAADKLQAANEELVATGEELRAQYEELARSEKQLRLLKISADRSSDQIFWLDFEGNILYANDTACRDYGYSRKEFSRMKIFELNPDVTAEIWRLSVEDLREQKNQFITTRHQRKDGSVMDVEIVAVYVNQDDREFSFAYVRDITARMKTETDLKTAYEQVTVSEEELRQQYDTLAAAEAEISSRRRQLEEVAATVPGVVYQFYARPDGSRGMYFVSSRAGKIFGLEPDLERFFPEFTSFVHPDDRARFIASIDDVIKKRSDWHFEGRFSKPTGESLWFEGRSTPVDRGGELVFSGVLLDITSRKNMEAAIHESEAKYHTLVDLSPVAVIVHRDGKILYANPEALRLAGAEREEDIIGKEVVSFIHPDDHAMATEDFRLLSEEGKTIPLKEERLVRIDGQPFTVEITAIPIQYQGTTAILAVFRDITRRKQAESALAESERKYRTVFETAEEGIWIVDTEFRTVSANRKMQALFGYTEQEMKGCPVWEFVPPDDAESMKQELSTRPRGVPGRYERRWIKKDGTVIWCLTTGTPLFSQAGQFLGSFGMFTDITERKQIEEALRESEKKYRLLMENIPFGITLIDADHRIVMSNVAQGQMFHTDAGLWPGRYCYREFEKRDTVCTHCPGTRAMATGLCQVVETEGVRDDGTRFNARIHAIPLPDAEARATRFIEVVEDITERKKAEDALRQNEEKYRTLIETTGTGFIIIDQDGRVLDANPEYVRMTGHSRLEEIAGRNVIEWTAENERERSTESLRQCMRNGFIHNFEIDYAGSDGTIIPIEINATVIHSKGAVQILTLCRDISDRRRTQDALKTSAEDYQTILRTAMDGFCIIALDGSFIDINEAFCRLIGYPREEALALTLRDVEVWETTAETSRHIENIIKKGYDRFETQWRKKDGRIIDVEVSVLYTGMHNGRFITFSRDITERKMADMALRESEAKFHAVIDQSFQLIGLMTPDGTLIDVNQAALELVSTSDDKALNRPFWETPWWSHSRELQETLKDAIRRAASGETVRFEATHPAADGHLAYIDFSVKPVVDSDGRIRYLIPEGRDITDRKRVEDELLRLKICTDNSSDEVFWMDFDGNILYVNDAACRITGYSRDEFLKMKIFELDPDFPSQVWNASVADLRERKTQFITTRHRRKDGSIMDVEIMTVYVNQYDKEYSFAYVRDITERKRTEEALFSSQQMLQAVLDSIPQRVFWKDRNSVFLGCNKPLALDAGFTDPAEMVGKTDYDHASHATAELYRADDRQVMETGLSRINYEEPQIRPDGSRAWLRTTKVPLRDKEGTIIGVLGTYEDITDRKRTEEALRESEAKFRKLITAAPLPMSFANSKGEIEFINNRFTELFGYTNEDIPTLQEWFDRAFPDREYQKQALATWDAAVKKGLANHADIEPAEYNVTCRDGTVRNVIISGITIEGKLLATFIDMTGRRKAEEALRENEEKYRTLVESSFDGIAIHQDGILVYVNRTAARLLGSDNPGDFVGRNAIDIVAPAFRDRIIVRVEQAAEQSMDLIHEQFLRLDGTAIDVDVTTTPTTWQGRPAAYVTFRDITAQKRAEEALRESEEKYRMLVEQSRDGIFIIQDGRLVFYNHALTGLSGYTAEELDGRPLAELVAPEDREMVVSRAQDRARGMVLPELYEFSLLHKDKHRRIRVRVSAGLGSYKGLPASIGTFYDVTEDRKREEALRESEEKFRALVETTSDFIWEVDAEGRYTYVSPQVRHILGYEPEELVGKTPFDLMPPDEREGIAAEFNRCVTSQLPITALENKALRKDGSVVLLETSGVVRTAKDGSYQGYRGIDRDITVRKQAEEALLEKTEELNRYFTASLDLFCIAGTDGYFRRLNPEWEKTLGYTLDELEGRRFLDFVHPDDLEPTLTSIADLSQQKTVLNFTNRYRHKDGTYRWIEWRSLPVGKLIFAAARDITARHEAAERTERISALKQDLIRTAPLEEKLKRITDAIVKTFGADFARIWIVGPGDLCDNGCIHAAATDGAHACRDRTRCLHLVVSSGRYTHTNGGHRRVPFGAYKIGRIASDDETRFVTNDVTHDPRVHDHAWAESLGLVSFAGFRLVSSEGKPIGVLAFFSRQPVAPEVIDYFDDLATTTSQVIQTDMAEQALRESEAQLSSILHGSPVLQFVIDRNHRVISWNKALEEYSGIRAADMIGTDQQWRAFYTQQRPVLADLLIDKDTGAISRIYAGKFRKSRYVEGAYEATDFFPQMGSSGKWLSFTAAPVRDVRGTIIGAVETLEDVTERIEAENTIRESEEWTRTILNTAQAGIILVDADTHTIIDANKKALELIGLDTGAVVGQVCHRFICPAEKGRCPVTDLYQKVDTTERVLLTAAGETIPVLKTVIPVTIRGRSILVESFVDITEQKQAETAIREANRKLNLLNSITRHDIRNQLMVAQGFTQLAGLSRPDTTVMDFLAKITAAIETIQRQIDFTKEYQELGVHAPAWFKVDGVVSSVRPEKIALKNSCTTVEIYSDPMIDKVFFNLFDNAMKYGERVTEVTVGCEEIDEYLVITFADNGCGIAPAEKEKIFMKGYGKNTGFGLFLVREILSITGITIHENGTYGEGAVFEIMVPKGAYRKAP